MIDRLLVSAFGGRFPDRVVCDANGRGKRGAILAVTQPNLPHFYLMNHLSQALTVRVDEWRKARYECLDFPSIGEILDFAL